MLNREDYWTSQDLSPFEDAIVTGESLITERGETSQAPSPKLEETGAEFGYYLTDEEGEKLDYLSVLGNQGDETYYLNITGETLVSDFLRASKLDWFPRCQAHDDDKSFWLYRYLIQSDRLPYPWRCHDKDRQYIAVRLLEAGDEYGQQ